MVQSRRFIRFLGTVQLVLWLLLAPFAAVAQSIRCPTGNITVIDTDAGHADVVCQAAVDTIAFMERYGLSLKGAVTISIVDKLTKTNFASSLGTYDARENQIEMLTFDAAVKQLPDRPAFGVPMTPQLYRSFVVHELAHAIAQPNFVRRPLVAAHEYIAYAAQLSTMDPELRDAVLRSVDAEGYEHLKEVGDMLLAVDPSRFAVKSYLHFIGSKDGTATFQQLLTGWY